MCLVVMVEGSWAAVSGQAEGVNLSILYVVLKEQATVASTQLKASIIWIIWIPYMLSGNGGNKLGRSIWPS